jgi:tRNA nucleotidyltransferase (CCA-adding enzyme)
MKDYLNNLPQGIKDVVHLARDVASHKGMKIYLVGGFVRDLLLKVENLDLDIVVEGDGINFSEEFASHLKAKLIRHRRFQTATLILKNHAKIDVTSARWESYPEPAHLPVVSRGNLRDDLYRRDFTINAMAIDIGKQEYGKFIDYFGGMPDLRERRVRILHDMSFIDDPTRILRAVRFQKRYNFRIDPQTLRKLKEALSLKMLEKVEPQRIRDELILMLKEKNPLKEMRVLAQLSGFSFFHSDFSLSEKNSLLLEEIGKEIAWFRKAYPKKRALDTWLIYFMGLLDSMSLAEAMKICKRLVLRKGEEKRVYTYKKINRRFILKLTKEKPKPSQVFTLLEPLSYEVIILLKAKYKNPVFRKRLAEFFRYYNGMRIHTNGDDLRELGLTPGPHYQKLFARLLMSRLDGELKSKDEELALIRKLIR